MKVSTFRPSRARECVAISSPTMPNKGSTGLKVAAELFRRQQRQGQTPGGGMMVRRGGETILAEAVGVARPNEGQPITSRDWPR